MLLLLLLRGYRTTAATPASTVSYYSCTLLLLLQPSPLLQTYASAADAPFGYWCVAVARSESELKTLKARTKKLPAKTLDQSSSRLSRPPPLVRSRSTSVQSSSGAAARASGTRVPRRRKPAARRKPIAVREASAEVLRTRSLWETEGETGEDRLAPHGLDDWLETDGQAVKEFIGAGES